MWCMICLATERIDLSEETAVPEYDSTASVDDDSVLPVRKCLCDDAGIVPLCRMVPMLVLDLDGVTRS